jgi:N-acetylneuraminate synthase/N,N'-diacetyllegionaminate synthase
VTHASIPVGDRRLGAGAPCLVAAEVGINHNGDMELAHALVDAAADAGAHAVKFQNYRTGDFVRDRSIMYEYTSRGETVVESQYDMFKRCELSSAALRELREHCERRGTIFFSTPTSAEGVRELRELGAPLMKNGSDYLVNLDLIAEMAASGLPTLISTGMATLAEIDDAVRAFRAAGGEHLALLHCTSSYPTRFEDVHLRKIPALAAAFGCPVGLSDHSSGVEAALGAVALGACLIEKHFTLDRELPGPDHWFSSTPDELRRLVDGVRAVELSLGQPAIGPTATEAKGRREFRLSCVAARALPAGHALAAGDVEFGRPGGGLAPKGRAWLVGRTLAADVPEGHVFAPADFAA